MNAEIEASIVKLQNDGNGMTVDDDLALRCSEIRREHVMTKIRFCLHAIVDCFVPKSERDIVKAACDAGVAAGFYGSGSAIAQGLSTKFEGVRSASARKDAALLRRMVDVGFEAGTRCHFIDVRKVADNAQALDEGTEFWK